MVPFLHARFHLDMFITRKYHSYVDITRVSLFLPQIVVDSRLNVGAQLRGLQPFGRKPVLFAGGARLLVTTITFKSRVIHF